MYQRKLMTIIWLPWVEALYHENGNQVTPTTFRRSDKSLWNVCCFIFYIICLRLPCNVNTVELNKGKDTLWQIWTYRNKHEYRTFQNSLHWYIDIRK